MRVLIYSTSPAVGTGYGVAAKALSHWLLTHGHEPAVFAWNSHVGHVGQYNGVPVYPRGNTISGVDMLARYVRLHEAEVVIAICDPWIIPADRWTAGHDARVVFWFPCQSEPASKALVDVCRAGLPLCYSQWGTDVMQQAGVNDCRYVPLGVDTSVFRPSDKSAARAWLSARIGYDLTQATVCGMVAANHQTIPHGRKAFDIAMLAFAEFKRRDPAAVLYLHTWPGPEQGGQNLLPMVKACGLEVGRDVLFPDLGAFHLGLPDTWLAQMYAAFDVCMQATSAEGFGLPILEAQACGIPVITTAYSSMPELTVYGEALPPALKVWSAWQVEGWVAIPDYRSLADAIECAVFGDYGDPARGVEFAAGYDWSAVIEDHLMPAIGESICV